MINRDGLSDLLEGSETLFADGWDDCIIGVGTRCGQTPILVYDTDKIIQRLMDEDGMSWSEASEYFSFNIEGAWMGEGTPIFCETLEEMET